MKNEKGRFGKCSSDVNHNPQRSHFLSSLSKLSQLLQFEPRQYTHPSIFLLYFFFYLVFNLFFLISIFILVFFPFLPLFINSLHTLLFRCHFLFPMSLFTISFGIFCSLFTSPFCLIPTAPVFGPVLFCPFPVAYQPYHQ